MSSADEIIVFYWPGSPWASKVTSYLQLRGIKYTECHQPITMPRPDLAALGVNYRRIPVVSIGRDVYCDTLLILETLEKMDIPAKKGKLSAPNGEQKALEKLLEKWTDLAVFPSAADCIPVDHPLVVDPKFIQDRTELWGETWEPKEREKKRPVGLANMRLFFDFLEETLLSDGRDWALGTIEPTLADIHGAWIFEWMLSLDGSFPEELISAKIHPKTFAWCERYKKAIAAAKDAGPEPAVVEGKEAIDRVSKADFHETNGKVESTDPLKLKSGAKVTMGPVDTGKNSRVAGELVALDPEQMVVGSKTDKGADIHVHSPRWNFSVTAA